MLCLYAEGEIVMLCVLLTAYDCRKRCKSLRDTQEGEENREGEVQERGWGVHQLAWHYSQIMTFLNDFTEDRATSSNVPTGGSQGQGNGGNAGEDATASQASSDPGSEFTVPLEFEATHIQTHIQIHIHTHIHTINITITIYLQGEVEA